MISQDSFYTPLLTKVFIPFWNRTSLFKGQEDMVWQKVQKTFLCLAIFQNVYSHYFYSNKRGGPGLLVLSPISESACTSEGASSLKTAIAYLWRMLKLSQSLSSSDQATPSLPSPADLGVCLHFRPSLLLPPSLLPSPFSFSVYTGIYMVFKQQAR